MKTLIATLLTLMAIPGWAGELPATDSKKIISIDEDGNHHEYSLDELSGTYGGTFDASALPQYQSFADKTGGAMSFCPKFEELPKIMDFVLDEILKTDKSAVDVALVLDVTGSMGDEIHEVKKNLARLIDNIQKQATNKDIKVALLVYRDLNQTDEFNNKIVQDFTSDLQTLNVTVQSVVVNGGEDTAEAILDALEVAEAKLSWRLHASHNVILIGDAPGHEISKTTGASVDEVLNLVSQDAGIKVFPMLVANVGSFGGDFGGFGDFPKGDSGDHFGGDLTIDLPLPDALK